MKISSMIWGGDWGKATIFKGGLEGGGKSERCRCATALSRSAISGRHHTDLAPA